MNLTILFLLISFPLLVADSNEWIEPLFTKEQYESIESFAKIKFKPEEKCPCEYDYLNKMTLAYFQWVHSETNEMQLARYLISEGYFEGTFGKVYHATAISYPENKPFQCVAIKMAKERNEINANVNISEEDIEKMINTEFDVVASFGGAPHIIGFGPPHFYNISPNGYHQTAIVMQIGKDFLDYLTGEKENGKNYSQEIMLKILKQILIGIHEIHQNNFIHLDLKTANILKMPGTEIYLKLIDFGGAIKLKNGQSKEVDWEKLTTTPPFEAAEIYEAKNKNAPFLTITKKADIWSFGMIILDLLFLILPIYKKEVNFLYSLRQKDIAKYLINHNDKTFQTDDKMKNMKNFLDQVETHYPRLLEISKKCLEWEPEKRPTAEKLLEEYFKDISTPAENADFFGEMTKYLDEQFNQISIKLAEEALKTGRLERPTKNNLSANNKIINEDNYGNYGIGPSKSIGETEKENTKQQEIEPEFLDENLYLAHQSHQNREGLQKKYTKILERNNKQKQKSPAENVLQNPHKNSQTDNLFSPKVKPHQFIQETGSSSKHASKYILENKRTHHRSLSFPQNLITIRQRPTFKKRHQSIDIHFHHKKTHSHEAILIRHSAINTPKLRRSFAIRLDPNLSFSALSPNRSKIMSEKHREISSSSSINENEIQLEEDFGKSKSPENKLHVGIGTNVLPSRDISPLHSLEQIGRKGFKIVTNIALGPSNYGKYERKTKK